MTTKANNAAAFLSRLDADAVLRERFKEEDVSVANVLDWAREYGFEFTKTDLKEAIVAKAGSPNEPLAEEELQAVSGGAVLLRENIEFPFVKKVLFPERYS